MKSLILLLLFASVAAAQNVKPCPASGDSQTARIQQLDLLKNRASAPRTDEIDMRVTLAAMNFSGDDTTRWFPEQGATIEGYVVEVKDGGRETANCHSKMMRDTHIAIVLDERLTEKRNRIIVEVTPISRALAATQGVDLSTGAIRKNFLHRQVKVTGWMFFDAEHQDQAENTNPGNKRNWRASAWEVHPVFKIELVN